MPRMPAPTDPPVVLTIAGSDAGGGAGVQADVKTIEAGGAFATTAITATTAQNTRGVRSTHGVPVEDVEAQVEAVLDDFRVAAVKTGMLGTAAVVGAVRERADRLPNLVVDPVIVATSGDRLLDAEAEDAYADLLARARLVTPNADEASILTDVEVTDPESAREAGERLVEAGAGAALVTGGHLDGETVVDTLVTPEAVREFRHERVDTAATHGSGCALSSAVATRLAHGDDLEAAVGEAVALLDRAVRYHLDVGANGGVHHAVAARDEAARSDTRAAVQRLRNALRDRDTGRLVPPGVAVAGATPYAESPPSVATPANGEGGQGRPADSVTFDGATPLAERLLAARETLPALRYAVALRPTDAVRAAVEAGDVAGADDVAAAETTPVVAGDPPTLYATDDDALVAALDSLLAALSP